VRRIIRRANVRGSSLAPLMCIIPRRSPGLPILKTIAEFQIQYSQFLNAEGKAAGPLPDFARKPDELLKMYRMMTLVRTFDTKAINLQRTGKLGTYASCLGHEATHVGTGAAMQADDVLVPVYREYGAQFWRGVKMENVLLYWGGDDGTTAEEGFSSCFLLADGRTEATLPPINLISS